MNHTADKLASYVEALRPIIYVPHFEFDVVDDLIRKVSGGVRIFEYTDAGSFLHEGASSQRISPDSLQEFLAYVDDADHGECFIVLKDVHTYLREPHIIARLKSITYKTLNHQGFRGTVFIVASQVVIPPDLEPFITVFEVPHPSVSEIRAIIDEFASTQSTQVPPAVVENLAVSLKGMHAYEITQILSLAYQVNGGIEAEDSVLILNEKEQIIKKSGMMEIVHDAEAIDDIGGLEDLKEWLGRKARIFRGLDRALKFGVDIPKGILIVGMPGCGKSLSAKATATLFEVPLLRLDMGKLLGKYVGESEENMRRALKVAEAVSPCVLWVDELEKAFAGIGGNGSGNEVTTRLLGYFLTWLQEKQSTVYVVATANDISKLPPEFLRRGRFDELFFVNFPTPDERRQIFEIHLKRRKRWHADIDTVPLLKVTEDFTGADIESVVKQAVENAFIDGQERITTEDLLAVIKETKSLKETLKDKVVEMQTSLSRFQFKVASRPRNTAPPPPKPHWSSPKPFLSRD